MVRNPPSRHGKQAVRPTRRGSSLVFPYMGLWMNVSYYDVDLSVVDQFAACRVPTLRIFGECDPLVDATRSLLSTALPVGPDSIHAEASIPGANHTFARRTWEDAVFEKTLSWLQGSPS